MIWVAYSWSYISISCVIQGLFVLRVNGGLGLGSLVSKRYIISKQCSEDMLWREPWFDSPCCKPIWMPEMVAGHHQRTQGKRNKRKTPKSKP